MNIQNIKPGTCYLVKEKEPGLSIELFKAAISKGVIGLLITTQHPKEIVKKYQLEDVKSILLADAKGENNLPITDLAGLRAEICKFIQGTPKSVILNLETTHLIENNNFEEIQNFIYFLQDEVWVSEACLIISIDPDSISKQELKLIGQYMIVIEQNNRN